MSTGTIGFRSDLAYGLRQIRKNPSLALLPILVLGMGIGSATAVFAVLYDALLKPPPHRDQIASFTSTTNFRPRSSGTLLLLLPTMRI